MEFKNRSGCCWGGAWASGGVLGRVGVFPRRLTHQLPKILMCSEVFLSARALPSVFLRLLKEWVEKFSVKSRFREIWSCSREWKLSCPQSCERVCVCVCSPKCFQCMSGFFSFCLLAPYSCRVCVCFPLTEPEIFLWIAPFRALCVCMCVRVQRRRCSNTLLPYGCWHRGEGWRGLWVKTLLW